MWMDTIDGLNRAKRQSKEEFAVSQPVFELGLWSFLELTGRTLLELQGFQLAYSRLWGFLYNCVCLFPTINSINLFICVLSTYIYINIDMIYIDMIDVSI